MPRVSAQHLEARREQILDAGMACFARNGFHSTSMQDVIAEAGLSVGAFYRYFRGKEELIEAIAERAVGRITTMIDPIVKAEPVPTVPEAIEMILTQLDPQVTRDGMFAMAIQVWAESLRNPQHAALVKKMFGRLVGLYAQIARRARDAGHLPADADPEAVGPVLFAMIPGYALQRLLIGHLDRETFLRGVNSLFCKPLGAGFGEIPDSGGRSSS